MHRHLPSHRELDYYRQVIDEPLQLHLLSLPYCLCTGTVEMAILQQLQSILTTPRVIGSCLFTYVVYLVILAVYRLYLSPIAHFPGAKITIVSGWYETYLDVFKGGQFTFQIERWHEAFGRYLSQYLLLLL